MSADGLTAQVPLCDRHGNVRAYATIDATDADIVGQNCWSLNFGYANSGRLGKLHRFILGLASSDECQVDHIDRDRLNCRRSNLRLATHGTNMQNKANYHGSRSRFRGVTWLKNYERWQARVQVNGNRMLIGFYDNEEEAGAAAREARLRLMPFATD